MGAVIPVISIVARSGTGKTTLLEQVVRELKADGIRVAVIKHDAHDFTMDCPGKDTWRFAEAGADIVAIASPQKMAVIEYGGAEKTLDEMIENISGVDVIVTEGYKHGNKPKIEVVRSAVSNELLSNSKELLGIVSDLDWEAGVPCYRLDDYKGVAKLIKAYQADFMKRSF